MKDNLLKKSVEQMLVDTEQGMALVDYRPSDKDVTINEDGEKSYTQEYLDNMPFELALGVGPIPLLKLNHLICGDMMIPKTEVRLETV